MNRPLTPLILGTTRVSEHHSAHALKVPNRVFFAILHSFFLRELTRVYAKNDLSTLIAPHCMSLMTT